ncbi:EEF1A lysine methyltransferase 3-like, partial [Cetorhinus maximus]
LIWLQGLALCRYFDKEQIQFYGKKVIELGSGTGIVGILATLLGGSVTLTDQPTVLRQIEINVTRNIPSAIAHRAKVAALSWGKDHEQFPTDYDIILGGDIVYLPLEFDALIKTLLHLSNQNTIIYISSKMRRRMGAKDFHQRLLPQHFNSEVIHTVAGKEIYVYKITKKPLAFGRE